MPIKLGDALLKVGVDKKDFDRDMKGLSGAIQKHKKAIGIAMVGMGVAAVGAAAASVKAFAQMGDEVQKMSIRTGFSTEALSELRHAAEISGADLSTLEKGVKRMSGTILDAQDGMETYVRAFKHIGIEVRELEGLKPEQQFLKIAEAIAEVEDPTKRAALAQDIFGRAGTELLPLFAQGKEGLAKLREEAHKLGIVFDKDAADSAAKFKDDLTRLDGAITGLKITLAKELMPTLDAGIPILTEWARMLGPILENTLNWFAAEDKQIKQQKAWQYMMLQRQRALGGLTHEYEASVDALESLLRNQDAWNIGTEATIEKLRAEIEARGFHKKAIEAVREAVEDQEAQIEAAKEAWDIYAESVEAATEALRKNKEMAAEAVARSGALIGQILEAGGRPSEERLRRYYEQMELAGLGFRIQYPGEPQSGGMYRPEFMQEGGIAMRPIPAIIAERQPEAVIPLDKLSEIISGGRGVIIHAHWNIDGREVAESIVGPLGDMTLQRLEMEGT